MLKVEDFKEVNREIRRRNPITKEQIIVTKEEYHAEGLVIGCNKLVLKHYISMLSQFESLLDTLLGCLQTYANHEDFNDDEDVTKAIELMNKQCLSEVEKVYCLWVYDDIMNRYWWDFEDDEIIKYLGQEQFELYKRFEIEEE